MDGIFLLIFWFIVNLLIKSAKDKKKIEEAKRRRTQELSKSPMERPKSKTYFENLKEELEKEIQREKERKVSQVPKKTKTQVEPKREVYVDRKTSNEEEPWENRRRTEKEIQEAKSIAASKEKADLQKDILRGIIFSEILSEPKSIQNSRRSM